LYRVIFAQQKLWGNPLTRAIGAEPRSEVCLPYERAMHARSIGRALREGTGPLWWVAEDAGAAGDRAEPSALKTEQVGICRPFDLLMRGVFMDVWLMHHWKTLSGGWMIQPGTVGAPAYVFEEV
jgi:hypothetical protein